MSIHVVNLATGDEKWYAAIPPRTAVACAHAQERGDWNTWEYDAKYAPLVQEGKHTFMCGAWSALKEGV